MNEEQPQPRVVRKYHQIGASVSACLSLTSLGFCYATSAFVVPQIEDAKSSLHVSKDEGSWFASVLFLGSLIGALTGGLQSDRLGRRASLIIDNCLFLVSSLGIALAPNLMLLLVARFISGYASASCLVSAPIYVSEVCQPKVRQLTVSLGMVFFTTGYGIFFLIGASMPWRIALGLSAVVPILTLIGLKVCPETPIWLLRHGKPDQVVKSLQFLRGDDEVVRDELASMEATLEAQKDEIDHDDGQSKMTRFVKMFGRRSFVHPFLLSLSLFIFGNEFAGFPAMNFYLVNLLQSSGLPVDAFWASAFLAILRSVLSLISSMIVLKFRRRPIFLVSGIAIVIANFIFAVYNYLKEVGYWEGSPIAGWIPLAAMALAFIGFSSGYQTISYFSHSELLPSDTRSLGSGVIGFIDNLAQFLVTKTLPGLVDLIGLSGVFWIFSSVLLVYLIIFFLVFPETHGMSLQDIESLFTSGSIWYRPRQPESTQHVS